MLWLGLTVAFEFGVFHYVMGVPWEVLLADDNVLRGRTWVLALATVLLGPLLAGEALRRGTAAGSAPDSGSPPVPEPGR